MNPFLLLLLLLLFKFYTNGDEISLEQHRAIPNIYFERGHRVRFTRPACQIDKCAKVCLYGLRRRLLVGCVKLDARVHIDSAHAREHVYYGVS